MLLMLSVLGTVRFTDVNARHVPLHRRDSWIRRSQRDARCCSSSCDKLIGADSALRLATRCHGGPHSGQCADPRGHHGHRRRVHDRAVRCAVPVDAQHNPRQSRPSRPPRFWPLPSRWWRTISSVCCAYSTVSQSALCFSFLVLALTRVAVFHLFTHAFFKALLFLDSGSVIHAMSGEQDMRQMGGPQE